MRQFLVVFLVALVLVVLLSFVQFLLFPDQQRSVSYDEAFSLLTRGEVTLVIFGHSGIIMNLGSGHSVKVVVLEGKNFDDDFLKCSACGHVGTAYE